MIWLSPVKECVSARSRNSDGRDGYENGRTVDEKRIKININHPWGVWRAEMKYALLRK
ncbi:hypothetical protein [Parabacteroides sp. ZJ-118]|uniref:hypothetical protein n=1 Tax=Parabacteroides sp. ZJ-118 TaxID=2709398 RepID=UPI0013E9F154|nr:hypothetical protein [Parabacteroides sp. ZJ-118]